MSKPWKFKFFESIIKRFSTHHESKDGNNKEENLEDIAAKEQKLFPYEVLAAATNNFSSKNKLGEGGFGVVYKGKLADGRIVAVKKLATGSKQGAEEFMNEAMLLSRVQHKNIVSLYGYYVFSDTTTTENNSTSSSTSNDHRHLEKLLVYDYVTHESLDKFLFDEEKKEELDWKKRYNIIAGVARGILYLHEDSHTTIIHRDIKASNILLDDKWTPKIADFGMTRLYPEDHTHGNTRVAGTNGYMAPEYLMHGQLSTKADVFSFGVLVLELVSGQKNSTFISDHDAHGLLEWAWRLYKKKQTLEMMDPSLAETAIPDQVSMCVQIGLLCTQADPKYRPTMQRVVVILSKKQSILEEPTKPGFPGSRYRRRSRGSPGIGSLVDFSSNKPSQSTSASATKTVSTPRTQDRYSNTRN